MKPAGFEKNSAHDRSKRHGGEIGGHVEREAGGGTLGSRKISDERPANRIFAGVDDARDKHAAEDQPEPDEIKDDQDPKTRPHDSQGGETTGEQHPPADHRGDAADDRAEEHQGHKAGEHDE